MGRYEGVDPPIDLTVVTLADFAATPEADATALLGDSDNILIPANGDVMVYGDGGAGKTTLCLDLACHLAAAAAWLGIDVAAPLRVLLVENEGPRPLFRGKTARKLKAWAGAELGDRIHIVEAPWAQLSLDLRTHREALAKVIAAYEIDIVVIGPLAALGMLGPGTAQEARDFLALCDEVRQLTGRAVTFVLIHHENKGGKVSGAWEGAGDTLLHVQSMGPGRTRLHVQKARWATDWHAKTLELRWTDGESFAIDFKPEMTDDDLAALILATIDQEPGVGWTKVSEAITGVRAARKRTVRDRLLADGQIVNVVREDGRDVASDRCDQGRHTRLFPAEDPTLRQLRPTPDEVGTKSSSARVRAESGTSSHRPSVKRDEGWDEGFPGAPDTSDGDQLTLVPEPVQAERDA